MDQIRAKNSNFSKLNTRTDNEKTQHFLFKHKSKNVNLSNQKAIEKYMCNELDQEAVLSINSNLIKKSYNLKHAENLFNSALRIGIRPNTLICNSIMSKYIKFEQWQKINTIVIQMKKNKIRLDATTYSLLIYAYEKNQQWQKIDDIFNKVKKKLIKVDIIICNALIFIYGRAMQWKKVNIILEQIKRNEIKSGINIHNTLIFIYGKALLWQEVDNILNQMQNFKIKKNIITYNTLINIYGCSNQWERVNEVINTMKELEIKFDLTSYDTLIFIYAQAKDWQKIDNMSIQKDYLLNIDKLILAYGEGEQWQKIDKLIAQNKIDNINTYNIIIFVYGTAKQWEKVDDMINQLKNNTIKPNEVTYKILLYLNDNFEQKRKIIDIFDTINESKTGTYNILIEIYEKIAHWQKTNNLIKQAIKLKIYKSSLGYEKSSLNLHENTVFENIEKKEHYLGIPLSVAKAIIIYLINKGLFDDIKYIIVGSHGFNILKNGVMKFMKNIFPNCNIMIDAKNLGRLIVDKIDKNDIDEARLKIKIENKNKLNFDLKLHNLELENELYFI